MKIFLSVLLLAMAGASKPAVHRISALKSAVQRGDRFRERQHSFSTGHGEITLRVAAKGVQVPLPKHLQTSSWVEIGEGMPALTDAGYTQWMVQKDGFQFKDAKDSKRTSCTNEKVTVAESTVDMEFNCKPVDHEDARFKVSPYGYGGYGRPYVGNGMGNGMNGMYGYGLGTGGLYGTPGFASLGGMTNPYMSNQFSNFWMPVTNGCPYGWNDYNWGAWNYNYYSVTPMGYWGCPSLLADGSCSINPYYYPFA